MERILLGASRCTSSNSFCMKSSLGLRKDMRELESVAGDSPVLDAVQLAKPRYSCCQAWIYLVIRRSLSSTLIILLPNRSLPTNREQQISIDVRFVFVFLKSCPLDVA